MNWDVIKAQDSATNETLCFASITALSSCCDSWFEVHLSTKQTPNIIYGRYAYDDHDSESGTDDIDSRMQMVIHNTNGTALVQQVTLACLWTKLLCSR